ncbi:hypothetical protein ACWEOP_27525 [Streptomyces chartreusis]
MVTITEEQVRQAEEKAKAAEEERVQAARALELTPYSDLASAEHAEASRLAAQLGLNAREIRQAFEEQVAEEQRRASRPELEAAAKAQIEAAGVELAERERAVIEALAQVQAAVVGLLETGAEYNAAVQSHADVLAGAGLDTRGGESGGTRTILNRYVLKVRGRQYEEVNAAAMAGWVLYRVVEARLSRFDGMATLLQWVARAVEQDSPELVARVPAPRSAEPAKRRPVVNALQALRGSK